MNSATVLGRVSAPSSARRAAVAGDTVTYVVNRNINFTNVCFVNCQFCAFKRQRWESDAYTHGLDRLIDTNRDGLDIDSCRNVHISGSSVNSPSNRGSSSG